MGQASTGAPPGGSTVRERVLVVAVMVAVVAAVLWPVVRQPPRDSFPLSTYPMFSSPKEPVVDIDVAVGVRTDGSARRLGPELIADTDEVIQAGALVRRAVAGGPATAGELCRTIAGRLSGSDGDTVAVEVRTDRYDAIGWYRGRSDPLVSTVHATCEVDG